jgi:hypothetical protein
MFGVVVMTYPFGRRFLTQILRSPQDSNTQSENAFENVKVHFPIYMKMCFLLNTFPTYSSYHALTLILNPRPTHLTKIIFIVIYFHLKFVSLFKPLMVHGYYNSLSTTMMNIMVELILPRTPKTSP